jgi:hypothetical protein
MSESLNTEALSIAKTPPDPNLKAFSDKFFKEDDSAVSNLAFGIKPAIKIEQPEIVGVKDLSRAQKQRFVELSAYYRQVFDERTSEPEDE